MSDFYQLRDNNFIPVVNVNGSGINTLHRNKRMLNYQRNTILWSLGNTDAKPILIIYLVCSIYNSLVSSHKSVF